MRPLYAEYKNEEINWQNTNGHAGLWFDKYCDQWALDKDKTGLKKWTLEAFYEGSGRNKDEYNPKRDWMDKIASKLVGNQEQLKEANQRIAKLANAYNQSPIIFTNNAPFVTGLGLNHPTENGFAWHHSLGTPYLAGSSVKGIVRAFATAWKNVDSSDIQRIFGPADSDLKNNKELNSSVGSVIFLDAIPTRQVQLKVDIMTPHYGPYYADDSGVTPPADWHMPVPIPFLVVAERQSFSFTILPRTVSDQADCKLAKEWLLEALEWIGAGAKTAVGYGRMFTDSSADALKTVDELEAETKTKDIESFKEGLRMQPNTIADEIKKLDSRSLAPDVKQTIASYMLDYVNANFKQKQLIKNGEEKTWYKQLRNLANK